MISNTADFKGAETFDVSADGTYPWTLAEGSGKSTVYVRFVGTNVDAKKTVSDEVVVDSEAPTVAASYVDENRVHGHRTRVWISLDAKDEVSGPGSQRAIAGKYSPSFLAPSASA